MFSAAFFPFITIISVYTYLPPLTHCLISVSACYIVTHSDSFCHIAFSLYCFPFSPNTPHIDVLVGLCHINFIQVLHVILTAILNNFHCYQNSAHYSNSSIQPLWLSNGLVSHMPLCFSGTIANCEIRNCILLAVQTFPALARAELWGKHHSGLMTFDAIYHFIPESLLDTAVSDSNTFLRKVRSSENQATYWSIYSKKRL